MSADLKIKNIFERNLHNINVGQFVLEPLQCSKNCGPGGTCLKNPLTPERPPVCRCDKGFSKRKDGKCASRYLCYFKQNINFILSLALTIIYQNAMKSVSFLPYQNDKSIQIF